MKFVCTLYYGEKAATKQKKARLRAQLACKGHSFIDKALKKGYNQTQERAQRTLSFNFSGL